MGFRVDIILLSLRDVSQLSLPGLQDLISDHYSSHQHPTHPHLHLFLKGFMISWASYSQSSSLTTPHPLLSYSLHANPCWLGVGWDGMGISLWWVLWCSFMEVETSFAWICKGRRGFYPPELKLLPLLLCRMVCLRGMVCLCRMGFPHIVLDLFVVLKQTVRSSCLQLIKLPVLRFATGSFYAISSLNWDKSWTPTWFSLFSFYCYSCDTYLRLVF